MRQQSELLDYILSLTLRSRMPLGGETCMAVTAYRQERVAPKAISAPPITAVCARNQVRLPYSDTGRAGLRPSNTDTFCLSSGSPVHREVCI